MKLIIILNLLIGSLGYSFGQENYKDRLSECNQIKLDNIEVINIDSIVITENVKAYQINTNSKKGEEIRYISMFNVTDCEGVLVKVKKNNLKPLKKRKIKLFMDSHFEEEDLIKIKRKYFEISYGSPYI